MRERGWREGQDYVLIETELPFDVNHAEEGVRALLAQKPDLIAVLSTAYAVAAHRQTKTIPILMFSSGYPVEAGVANSLGRPGKNVTGNAIYAGTRIWGKLLELLRGSKAGVKRVSVLWSYVPPAFPVEEVEPCYRELRQDAASLGLALQIVEVANKERLPAALAEIASGRPDALTGLVRAIGWAEAMKFAGDLKLPTLTDIVPTPGDTGTQTVLTYGANREELGRQFFDYVDRILKGAKPAELPIRQPSKFDLVVDLRAAKAIGLKLPPDYLVRADRVIE